MRFAKGHGTQNDFVLLFDPDGNHGLTAGLAARLCDRRTGIGADGVLRVVRTAVAEAPGDWAAGRPEWFMDYRNSDGSLAEMCGNGIRVFARYLARHDLAPSSEFAVATRSGARQVRLAGEGDITVEMGAVTVLGPGRATVGGERCEGLRICVGNPHLACLTDRPLAEFDLASPPLLDSAELPHGANVELVEVTGPGTLTMRVHERGSGETRSCGTGAIAAAMAAASQHRRQGQGRQGQGRQGLGQREWQVTVPGGQLTAVLDGGTSWLAGPAVIVAEGELDPAWLAAPEGDVNQVTAMGGHATIDR